MNITTNGVTYGFDDEGNQAVNTATVSISMGIYPNTINATIPVTTNDGLKNTSSALDIKKIGAKLFLDMVNKEVTPYISDDLAENSEPKEN